MKRAQALIHIGGGYLQSPGIRWAKELGLRVIVTDVNPDAPGRLLADQFEVLDGTDVLGLLALARGVHDKHQLVGAYASSDFGLPAVAAIAEEFQLPGCSRNAVELALNKSKAKKCWRDAGIRTPKGGLVRNERELAAALGILGNELILKPIDSSGSRGVVSVRGGDDLRKAFQHARVFSDAVLVEQIISGKHFDMNGFLAEGKFYRCGTMDRFFSDHPYNYPIWGCEPSCLDEVEKQTAYELFERAAKILGVNSGPVKGDFIWTREGPCILELAPRFHGDVSTSFVTPLACGGSPIRAWFACLNGQPDFERYLPMRNKRFAGWAGLFPPVQGKLKKIDGLGDIRNVPEMADVYIRARIGQTIVGHQDNTSLCGFVWATGIDRPTLSRTLSQAIERLEFIVE